MSAPIRHSDPFDPTAPQYPRFDPVRQPCRALLTEFLVIQGNQPGRTRLAKEELVRARGRLMKPRRDAVADERACADALGRLHKAVIEFRGDPPVFTAEEQRAPALWERLNGFLQSLPHSGVLADLNA